MLTQGRLCLAKTLQRFVFEAKSKSTTPPLRLALLAQGRVCLAKNMLDKDGAPGGTRSCECRVPAVARPRSSYCANLSSPPAGRFLPLACAAYKPRAAPERFKRRPAISFSARKMPQRISLGHCVLSRFAEFRLAGISTTHCFTTSEVEPRAELELARGVEGALNCAEWLAAS